MGKNDGTMKWVLIAAGAVALWWYLKQSGMLDQWMGGAGAPGVGPGVQPGGIQPGAGLPSVPTVPGVTPTVPAVIPPAITSPYNPPVTTPAPPTTGGGTNTGTLPPDTVRNLVGTGPLTVDQWSWGVQSVANKWANDAGVDFDAVFASVLGNRGQLLTWDQYLAAGGTNFMNQLMRPTGVSGVRAYQRQWLN